MIKQSDILRLFMKALDERWGYIYGEKGAVWTAEKQAAATREQTVKYGARWIGRRVTDCSGLACYAFRSLGGKMYHGSNTIWRNWVRDRAELEAGERSDGLPILRGDPVFKRKAKGGDWDRHHIGYYAGNGKVIEAKGTVYGVVESAITEWDETARWNDMEYDLDTTQEPKPEGLKKGDRGEEVKELQRLLNDLGEGLDVDGIFGALTEEALKRFQETVSLTPDGICGPDTWEKLRTESDEDTHNLIGGDTEPKPTRAEKLREIAAKLIEMAEELEAEQK